MALMKKFRKLMEEALSVLPSSDEDVVFRGVAESLMDRIVELKGGQLPIFLLHFAQYSTKKFFADPETCVYLQIFENGLYIWDNIFVLGLN